MHSELSLTDIQPATELLEALDRFLEAAATAKRDRFWAHAAAQLERAFVAMFRAQAAAFMAEMARQAGGFYEADKPWPNINWDGVLGNALLAGVTAAIQQCQQWIAAALAAGATDAFAGLMMGLSFDVNNPRAQEYIRQHGAELVTRINETTRKQMHDLILRGRIEGWSYDKLAKEIRKRWREFAVGRPQEHIDSRAHLVAVTEIGNAYEEGSYQAALQTQGLGIPMEKSWLTVGDERVCEICGGNEAEGWIPLLQEYPSGHLHPLGHPACRCTQMVRRARQ